MNKLAKDKLNSILVLILGCVCLVIGGISALQRQVIEAVVTMSLANMFFIVGTIIYFRFSIESRLSEGFRHMEERLNCTSRVRDDAGCHD